MSAPDARNDTEAYTPAIVRVQRDGRDRDDTLAAAVLSLWDAIVLSLDMGEDEKPDDPAAITALRHQLAASNRREWADAERAKMDAAHAQARRQSGAPPITRRFDGSSPRPMDDERDLLLQRQALLGPKSQAAKHASMGAKPAASWDATDAHAGTRAARAAMYERMRQEAER